MLPGLRPTETPPRLSWIMPGIQNGTGRTGQEERRGKPETGHPAEPICTTGSRSKKGHPEPEKGKYMMSFQQEHKNDILGCVYSCPVFDLNNSDHVSHAKKLAENIEKEVHPVMRYINRVENEMLNDKCPQLRDTETKLIQMYTLYMAAFHSCEITWDEAFYGFADFTAKLLKIR